MSNRQKPKPNLHRRTEKRIDKIVFDEDARREYLTGFHKRKVQRKEAEKKASIAKQKRVRRETRAENRRQLAERAKENARLVEKAYGGDMDGNDSEGNESPGAASGSDDPLEYEGQEQTATVTIVEDFDINDITDNDGPSTREQPQTVNKNKSSGPPTAHQQPLQKPPRTVSKKRKRPDFHYSTRAERMQERAKQLAKRKPEEKRPRRGKGHRVK